MEHYPCWTFIFSRAVHHSNNAAQRIVFRCHEPDVI